MAVENQEHVQECSPEHQRMGPVTLKYDKETEEELKKARRVNVERSIESIKKDQTA